MAVADPVKALDDEVKQMIADAVAKQSQQNKADFDAAVKKAVQNVLSTGQVTGVQSGLNQHYFDDPLGKCGPSPHPVISPSDACGKTHRDLLLEFVTPKVEAAA